MDNQWPQMPVRPETTLEDAKRWLRANATDGAKCPCCTQVTKIYRRRLNSSMAQSLIAIYVRLRAVGEEWIHVPSALSARSREEGKLAYWKLLQEADVSRPDGGRAGWWRLTGLGREFVLHRATVPEYAVIYDGRCLRVTGAEIDIEQALGTKFNYNELMGFAL